MPAQPSRREFLRRLTGACLGLATAGIGIKASANASASPHRIGLALGAGGATGLAHILVIEALEELNLRPYHITGSSIGAVIGALYAMGQDSAAIRALVQRYFSSESESRLPELLPQARMKWAELVDIDIGGGGLLSGTSVVENLYQEFGNSRFSDLEIPLSLVASDLWTREQVILNQGPLKPAVEASMAIPGIFSPVAMGERVLVDGGAVNPVPFDVLPADCTVVIAVDVSGVRSAQVAAETSYFQILFNSVKVMQQAIVEAKRKTREPDIYIAPAVRDVRSLEFYRAEEIYQQARPIKNQLKQELVLHLGIDP